MERVLIVLSTLALRGLAEELVVNCTNKYQCRQESLAAQGLRLYYAAFTNRENSALNISSMATAVVGTRTDCQIACLKTKGCWSVNYYSASRTCTLLNGNEYTSGSLMIVQAGWDHHSVETPCKSSPCRNNALCIPNLENGTFACNCMKLWTGKYCEIKQEDVLLRAQAYWTFDNLVENVGINKTITMTLGTGGRIIHVPDRKNTVLYCFSNVNYCIFNNKMPRWLILEGEGHLEASPNGFTISFWIKHTVATTEVIVVAKGELNGIYISINSHRISDRTLAWFAEVRSKNATWQCLFLTKHALLWTHNAIVFYPNNQGICCYEDGRIMANVSQQYPGREKTSGNMHWLYNQPNLPKPIVYLNDLGLWNEALKPEEIQVLFEKGKLS